MATGKRDQPFADAVSGQDADRIGAEPDECRMTERDQAGIADQKIERDGGDREHHHAGADVEQILPGRERRDRGQQRENKKNHRRQHHIAPGEQRERWLRCREDGAAHVSGLAPETGR